MKRNRIMFIAGAASLLAVAAFSSNPLPEDTMYAVRRMLRVAQKPFQDNLTWDYEVIELDYSQPEVFFGMIRLNGDWPVERRKSALDAYLAVMADTDFTDQTDNDRVLPFKATAQCSSMNYTNALPYMRRLVLNTTLVGWRRRNEIRKLIEFSPVNDETTATIETIFTNRVDFTCKDREKCFDYASKVVAVSQSNLVAQSVCDRAARVFTRDPTEWQLSADYDYFWKRYYPGYATSSNRLEFLSATLSNTNIPSCSKWTRFQNHFISVTNQLLSSGQPLPWINFDSH
jgi:hypothetical protein